MLGARAAKRRLRRDPLRRRRGAGHVSAVVRRELGRSRLAFRLGLFEPHVRRFARRTRGRFDTDWSLAGNLPKLYSRLAWAHDFDNEGVEDAAFLSLPGASFSVDTVKPAHDSALISVGFDYGLLEGWSLGGKFDGEFSQTTSLYSATGEIKKVW